MINGNRMLLSSISSIIANALNTYVNKVSVLNVLLICKKITDFALSLWGIED
jgi:hypothetical protein